MEYNYKLASLWAFRLLYSYYRDTFSKAGTPPSVVVSSSDCVLFSHLDESVQTGTVDNGVIVIVFFYPSLTSPFLEM